MSELSQKPKCSLECKFLSDQKSEPSAFLIFLKDGAEKIKFVFTDPETTSHDSEDGYIYLVINDLPILEWLESNSCPTCEQILKSGNELFSTSNLEMVKNLKLEDIKENPERWFEAVIPVLELMESGFYSLSLDRYYPTDGDGNLFWGSYQRAKVAKSVNMGDRFTDPNRPSFLIASQSLNKFSADRFSRAKTKYRECPGLALHLGGYLSILLDGHHRALAAAENGESFSCVTISRATWQWQGGMSTKEVPDHVLVDRNMRIETDQLSSDARNWLKKFSKEPPFQKALKSVLDFEAKNEGIEKSLSNLLSSISNNSHLYPTAWSLDAAYRVGLISDEDIEKAFRSELFRPNLDEILAAFSAAQDKRTRALALRIVQAESWMKYWTSALKYLSQYKDKLVADLFMDLYSTDIKRKDVMAVVDSYIRDNSNLYES